jgi:Ca-activated chloride channel family protein
MRLASPYFLLLLLLIPLLVWLRHVVAGRQSMQFSSTRVLQALPRTWRMRLRPVIPLCFALGLACWVVALARPQKGLSDSRVRTEAVDIILLLDLSESMDTRDFVEFNQRISRLEASKDVITRFLEKRPNDRIGMVGFASLPYAVAPLTLDHGWLIRRMEGLHTRMLDGRRTAIGDGIASAVNRLRESEAKSKIIILLTDGANNWGTLSPENAASAAAALDIKIYTIGAGGAGSGFMLQRSEVDEATLRKIAQTTGAQFYRARDLQTLDAVYAQIDQLEKTEIEVESYTRYEETAMNWILAGIVLLAMEQLLGLTKLGRLP